MRDGRNIGQRDVWLLYASEAGDLRASVDLGGCWTADDKKEYTSRTQCIADQYSGYTAVEDVKLNGKLTLGENTADNGGLRIAYMALLATFAGREPAPVDGLTAVSY